MCRLVTSPPLTDRRLVRIAVMMTSRAFICCGATCLLAVVLAAQSLPSSIIQGLLPPDAMIVEIADLRAVAGMQRLLVLWMQSPKQEVRGPDDGDGYGCADAVYG